MIEFPSTISLIYELYWLEKSRHFPWQHSNPHGGRGVSRPHCRSYTPRVVPYTRPYVVPRNTKERGTQRFGDLDDTDPSSLPLWNPRSFYWSVVSSLWRSILVRSGLLVGVPGLSLHVRTEGPQKPPEGLFVHTYPSTWRNLSRCTQGRGGRGSRTRPLKWKDLETCR